MKSEKLFVLSPEGTSGQVEGLQTTQPEFAAFFRELAANGLANALRQTDQDNGQAK